MIAKLSIDSQSLDRLDPAEAAKEGKETMKGHDHTHAPDCPHCHARGTVKAPDTRWKLAVAVAWMVLFAEVAAISLIGPFILIMGPLVLFTGASLLGFLHGKAFAPAECEACGRIAEAAQPRVTPRPVLTPAPARAA